MKRVALLGVTLGEPVGGYRPLLLDTTGGPLEARLYPVEGAVQGIVLLDATNPGLWQGQGICAVTPLATDPVERVMTGLVCAHFLQERGLQVLAWGPGAEDLARLLPGVELA